jgi:hypothetical protein
MSSERCSLFFFVRFEDSEVEEYCCDGDCDITTPSDDEFSFENFCTIRLLWRFVLLLLLSITCVALRLAFHKYHGTCFIYRYSLNSLYSSFWYRGLASADEQTRERVAREGGEARAEDKESLREGEKRREEVKADVGQQKTNFS